MSHRDKRGSKLQEGTTSALGHIGIDVHKNQCQICILTGAGELVHRRIRTERSRIAAVLGDRPRARILIEASTESEDRLCAWGTSPTGGHLTQSATRRPSFRF